MFEDLIPNIEKLNENDVILVTGGTGLFGSAIREKMEQQIELYNKKTGSSKPHPFGTWIFLSSKEGDLRDSEQCEKVFQKYKPTYVLHLAAFVGGLFKNMKDKVNFWVDNVSMNNNVMRCCWDFNVKRVVSCLSTCVFPDKIEKYPFNEKVMHLGPPHFSNNAYAYAKRMLDMLSRWYNEKRTNEKLEATKPFFTSVIPTNLFGRHDNYNVENGHVVPGLIHKCYLAKKENKKFVVLGSGKPLRQFVYSQDAAEIIVWSMLNYIEEEPIMITTSAESEISIADVAYAVKEAMDFQGEMVFDQSFADGQFKKTASNEKLMSYLPNYKFTPFKQAVKMSVDWFVENFDVARK